MSPEAGGLNSIGTSALNYNQMVAGTFGVYANTTSVNMSAKLDNYSLFGQDTWKIAPRFTVTYGLRWEVSKPPVPSGSTPALYSVNGVFSPGTLSLKAGPLWHTRYNNFAPRLGAAWWFTTDTVLRAGVGSFYDLGYGAVANWRGDLPYSRSTSGTSTAGITLDFNLCFSQFHSVLRSIHRTR